MSTTTAPDPAAPAEEKKGKGKLLVIVAVVLVLALGAAYWFLLRPGPEPEVKPGEVLTVEPVQVNLAGGHYLRIGIALQLTETAEHAEGSKALDKTIALFSGKSVEELSNPKERTKLKHELEEQLHEEYHDEVMGVYFTEFVTQ